VTAIRAPERGHSLASQPFTLVLAERVSLLGDVQVQRSSARFLPEFCGAIRQVEFATDERGVEAQALRWAAAHPPKKNDRIPQQHFDVIDYFVPGPARPSPRVLAA
jgi:hypothetical protein